MAILEIKNLNFSYDGKKQVLSDIDMDFKRGILYGIYGKSGAGKSTLLSLLAGLEKTNDGDILYEGNDIDKMSREKYRSSTVGIIFQSYNLLPQYTALENVILSMNISGIKEKNKKIKALELLNKVGIDEIKANRRVLQLSGGEQQRVSIARALSYDSKIILADEPTGNLDKETEDEIIDILKTLAHNENKCVIVVSHSLNVKKSVDHIYYLLNGKLKED
ncbi:MAG: ABC transporter ATP-binding protein [Bacilli bacterium]|nr:ABC transporter ATP-binding protein [Bacilli bacterium]